MAMKCLHLHTFLQIQPQIHFPIILHFHLHLQWITQPWIPILWIISIHCRLCPLHQHNKSCNNNNISIKWWTRSYLLLLQIQSTIQWILHSPLPIHLHFHLPIHLLTQIQTILEFHQICTFLLHRWQTTTIISCTWIKFLLLCGQPSNSSCNYNNYNRILLDSSSSSRNRKGIWHCNYNNSSNNNFKCSKCSNNSKCMEWIMEIWTWEWIQTIQMREQNIRNMKKHWTHSGNSKKRRRAINEPQTIYFFLLLFSFFMKKKTTLANKKKKIEINSCVNLLIMLSNNFAVFGCRLTF